MTPVRALIVDDEALARERLRTLLAEREDVEVVAEARDGAEALEAVKAHDPELLFLDVQMPEMDGFEVIAALAADTVPAVVFVTAYDHYAVRAFEVHALDYLLKPFDRDRFRESVDLAVKRLRTEQESAIPLDEIIDEIRTRAWSRPVRRFVVQTQGRIRFVPADEIEWVEAEGNYVALHVGSASHLVRGTMKRMETLLDDRRFMRVHRSAIVNVERIQEVRRSERGEFLIITEAGHEIATGETYRPALLDLLKNPLEGPAD